MCGEETVHTPSAVFTITPQMQKRRRKKDHTDLYLRIKETAAGVGTPTGASWWNNRGEDHTKPCK